MTAPQSSCRAFVLALAALFGLLSLWSAPATAHIQENGTNLRVAHVAAEADGFRVFYRINFALLVANQLGPELFSGAFEPAPYTSNRVDGGRAQHFIDGAQIRQQPEGLGQLLLAGHTLRADGATLHGTVRRLRVHVEGSDPPYRTLAEMDEALEGPLVADIGDGVLARRTFVDAEVFYPAPAEARALTLASTLAPGEMAAAQTVNMLVYQIGEWSLLRRIEGLLEEPVALHRSRAAAFGTFLLVGAEHILGGFDHLLFVLCLLIGAASLSGLLWRVTGFTAGHTVTLIAGFLGYAPRGAWFVPTVEVAIALSIVLAAMLALMRRDDGRSAFVITGLVGLIHGFGFSFALRDILSTDDPDLLLNLLAFNGGVELGQLAIVLAAWPLLRLIDRAGRGLITRRALAMGATAVAGYWIALRVPEMLQVLTA